MKIKNNIQIKAFLLLVIFGLNMLVGFACAIGLNSGFIVNHHSHEHPIAAIIGHDHNEPLTPHHDHHHEANSANKSATDDDCCSKDVITFVQLDKLLAHAVNIGIEAPAVLVHFYFLYPSYSSLFTNRGTLLRVVRPYVESSRGIRVSIQSFQI